MLEFLVDVFKYVHFSCLYQSEDQAKLVKMFQDAYIQLIVGEEDFQGKRLPLIRSFSLSIILPG